MMSSKTSNADILGTHIPSNESCGFRLGEQHDFSDTKGGDLIKSKALTQVFCLVQITLFDMGSLFQRIKETFDRPSSFIPAQGRQDGSQINCFGGRRDIAGFA